MICWKLYLISLFFVFSWLIVWADRISKCDRCLAVGRGDADPKCNLIISPFLTLPDLLDCLNFTRDAMPIVLLLKLMGDGLGGVGVDLYLGVGGGTGGGYYLIVLGFFLTILWFAVSCSQSLYLGGENMMAVGSFSLFFLYFLCLKTL